MGVASSPARSSARGTRSPRRRANGLDVGGEVDLVGADLRGQRRQLALGRPAAHHQPRAALAQRGVEVGEALEQELRARAGGVAAVQQAVVEAEHRHDPLVAVERGAQGGMVAQAQVAAEPDERLCCPRGAT